MIKVGFVGLGRIGKPMAINIVKAGHQLAVYDLRQEPLRELAELGAKAARSPAELARGADIVEIAVVDDPQVEEVVAGDGGLIYGCPAGAIIAIHSTVYPETVRSLAKVASGRGIYVIDAPVSGGETGAREKTLCYMIGGEPAVLERCRDIFSTSASKIVHLGELGSGATAKIIVQIATCINMLAAHEAEVLAARAGLNLALLQQVLHESSGQSFVIDNWRERFKLAGDSIEVRRRRTSVFKKSLAPAIRMARELGLSLPGTVLTERLLPQIMEIEDS